MTIQTADKKIKLSDAQRSALKKFYNVERGNISTYFRSQIAQPTQLSLNKLGLIDGRVEPKTWRGAARIYETKLSTAGLALAERLFGMDWWAELIGAFISHERTAELRKERIANAQTIAQTLNLETELELSGSAERGYTADYKSELIDICVYKTYFGLRENQYVLQPKIKPFQMTENQARLVAELLCDAANVLRTFKNS